MFQAGVATALLLGAGAALAQGDAQVYESAIAEAQHLRPGHSEKYATPAVRASPLV